MSHNHRGFIAAEECLEFYNGVALIDLSFEFLFLDEDNDNAETAFGFDGYVSAYFKVYNERESGLMKDFANQLSRTTNFLIMNCSISDMTFEDLGKYYYEMGYIRSGGYEIPLRYGELKVI